MNYLTGSIKTLLIHLIDLIDLIYPHRCPLCDSHLDEKRPFCDKCLDGFKRLLPPFCSICAVPFDNEAHNQHLCEDCLRKRPYFKSISAPYVYNKNMSKAVHLYKYQGKAPVGNSLGILLAEFAKGWWKGNKDDHLIVPVPLSPKRLRQRGFNQSLFLAKHVARATGIPVDYMSLRRSKDTQPQSLLKRDDRKKNVKNAFTVLGSGLKGKKVILVDDVATTGSTLNECAKALSKSGAKEVQCMVLARTDPRHITP